MRQPQITAHYRRRVVVHVVGVGHGADEIAVVVGIEERPCGEAFPASGCFDDATVEVFAGDRRVVSALCCHSFGPLLLVDWWGWEFVIEEFVLVGEVFAGGERVLASHGHPASVCPYIDYLSDSPVEITAVLSPQCDR